MWQMYGSLVKYIWSGNIKDKVEIKFVDIMKDNIRDYPAAYNLIYKGYALPLVAINGIPRFYGGINHEKIYVEIEKCLNK